MLVFVLVGTDACKIYGSICCLRRHSDGTAEAKTRMSCSFLQPMRRCQHQRVPSPRVPPNQEYHVRDSV